MKNIIKEWIKKIYFLFYKCAAIPAYYKADAVPLVKNNPTSPTKYLVLRYGGKSGLMTQMVVVLGWLYYAQQHGFILLVDMNSDDNMYQTGKGNVWEEFFLQPMSEHCVSKEYIEMIMAKENYAICPNGVRHNLRYEWKYSIATRLFKPTISFPLPRDFVSRPVFQCEMEALYAQYIRFAPSLDEYIQVECAAVLKDKGKVLGCLVRGTDYVQSKPYMHPVQPTVDEVLDKAAQLFDDEGWDYIYLATEEEAVEKRFEERFPGKILTNCRHYLDKDYNNTAWLSDSVLQDKNFAYQCGVEYASSVYILSKCDMLIGGLCGGTQAALIMNGHQYSTVHLFEHGNYGE